MPHLVKPDKINCMETIIIPFNKNQNAVLIKKQLSY